MKSDSIYKFISYGFVRGRIPEMRLEHEYEDSVKELTEKAEPKVEPIKLVNNDGC